MLEPNRTQYLPKDVSNTAALQVEQLLNFNWYSAAKKTRLKMITKAKWVCLKAILRIAWNKQWEDDNPQNFLE